MYLKETCYKMGVNHPKKTFFEILKIFGLFKPKKNVLQNAIFSKKIVATNATFSTNVDQSTKNKYCRIDVKIYVVSPLKRILDSTSRKKVKECQRFIAKNFSQIAGSFKVSLQNPTLSYQARTLAW